MILPPPYRADPVRIPLPPLPFPPAELPVPMRPTAPPKGGAR